MSIFWAIHLTPHKTSKHTMKYPMQAMGSHNKPLTEGEKEPTHIEAKITSPKAAVGASYRNHNFLLVVPARSAPAIHLPTGHVQLHWLQNKTKCCEKCFSRHFEVHFRLQFGVGTPGVPSIGTTVSSFKHEPALPGNPIPSIPSARQWVTLGERMYEII